MPDVPYIRDMSNTDRNQETTMSANGTIGTTSTITFRGIALRRKTEAGDRGGQHYIYQAASADPVWGYWYYTASQAARCSNPSDRVCLA